MAKTQLLLMVGLLQVASKAQCLDIPKCMEVTIAREHYNAEARTLDSSIGGYDIGAIPSIRYGPNNQTVSFCFPSSPQLLSCKTRALGPWNYTVEHHVLSHQDDHFSAALGDYYIDQEGVAHVCTEAIVADRSIPRCNFITLESGMYAELGNDTLYINSTNSTLSRATYTTDSAGRANACIPLTIQTINCNHYHYFTFRSKNYNWLPHMRIGYKQHHNQEYGPGEYYSLADGALRVCIFSSPALEYILGYLYYVLEQLSLVCLCLTLMYQLMVRQSNLHDKCLACFNVTMIALYLSQNFPLPEETCHSYFVIFYVLKMSSYTWLTLTAFDIWKSFSTMRRCPNRQVLRSSKKFIYYSVVGWISPFLWYVFVLATSKYYDIFAQGRTIDMPSCWFKTIWAFFAFYYGPALIVCTLNVVFFVLTIRAIHREARKAKAARANGKKQVVIVCIKLFIVMGISLIAEGFTLSFQHYFYFHHFYISGAFLSTQGIATFIVVICKREAFRAIRNHVVDLKLKWDALTINCDIFNKKKSIPIYLVEENHLNVKSKQIACTIRTYILHDDAEGDTFNRNNMF